MYALVFARIGNLVWFPAIEYPGLTRRHVNRLGTTVKTYRGFGDDRYMDTYAITPVIMYVIVHWNLGSGSQPHQARASEDCVECSQHLPDIRASFQVFRGSHGAVDGIIDFAIDGNQYQCRIAGIFMRVFTPLVFLELPYFGRQALDIEMNRQFVEFTVQFHS